MKGSPMQQNIVRVELHRGRISLGRAVPGLKPNDLLEVTVEDDGTIILVPVKTVPIHKKTAKRDESR